MYIVFNATIEYTYVHDYEVGLKEYKKDA